MAKSTELRRRDWVVAIPDIARLLWNVTRDDRVPLYVRGGLIGMAAYLVLPVDIVPDWVPVVGQLDDVVVLTVGMRGLLRRVPDAVLREHWKGDASVLEGLLGRKLRDARGNGGR